MSKKHRSHSDYFVGEYENDPIGLLAAEIVIFAIKDWRELVNKKAWTRREYSPRCNLTELREFFRGEWCAFLVHRWNVAPERILEMLEAELQQAMQQTKGSGENGL